MGGRKQTDQFFDDWVRFAEAREFSRARDLNSHGSFFSLRFEMSKKEVGQEMLLPTPVYSRPEEDEEREVDVLKWMLRLLIEAASRD